MAHQVKACQCGNILASDRSVWVISVWDTAVWDIIVRQKKGHVCMRRISTGLVNWGNISV